MTALTSIAIYASRSSRAWNRLSWTHFDVFNDSRDTLALIGGGCLDAPDAMPSGSMHGFRNLSHWGAQSIINREFQTLAPAQRAAKISDAAYAAWFEGEEK